MASSVLANVVSTARDYAVYGAIRSVIAAATVAEPDAVLSAAQVLGRTFARAPFNRKRLQRAVDNLAEAFPQWSEQQRRDMAVRGYEHLCMLGMEMAGTNRVMTEDGWPERARLHDLRGALGKLLTNKSVILVTGHVGNWELTGYLMAMLQFRVHAIYRPLDLKPLDAWVRQSRSRRGLYVLDKFQVAKALPDIMSRGECPGFVADQNAGERGQFVPFFGRLASTYKAIGLTAARYDIPVVVGWAKREGGEAVAGQPGAMVRARALRFDLHIQDAFGPEDWKDAPDPAFYITARYRRALEGAIAQAPEQTLWMHRFWKSRPKHEREQTGFPASLERKLRELPWMTEAELARIKARSDRDAADIAAGGGERRERGGRGKGAGAGVGAGDSGSGEE
jgi:KDO2-lipid IV(A) lauroyltransferase